MATRWEWADGSGPGQGARGSGEGASSEDRSLEGLFRGTRVRVSSENVGLARHPEGLELARIGEPLRPEFAAWRYGDQFGRWPGWWSPGSTGAAPEKKSRTGFKTRTGHLAQDSTPTRLAVEMALHEGAGAARPGR